MVWYGGFDLECFLVERDVVGVGSDSGGCGGNMVCATLVVGVFRLVGGWEWIATLDFLAGFGCR